MGVILERVPAPLLTQHSISLPRAVNCLQACIPSGRMTQSGRAAGGRHRRPLALRNPELPVTTLGSRHSYCKKRTSAEAQYNAGLRARLPGYRQPNLQA
jgi:hypothetical protein